MTEFESRIQYRKKWIAKLETDIAAMGDDGFPANTADGARLCAAVMFGEYSVKLDKLRTIKECQRDLYGQPCGHPVHPEIAATQARIDQELARIRGDRTIVEWPEQRLESAAGSFLAVVGGKNEP